MAGRRVRNNGGWKEAAEKKVKRHRRTRQIRVLEGAGMSGGKCGEARAGDTFKVADVTSNPQRGTTDFREPTGRDKSEVKRQNGFKVAGFREIERSGQIDKEDATHFTGIEITKGKIMPSHDLGPSRTREGIDKQDGGRGRGAVVSVMVGIEQRAAQGVEDEHALVHQREARGTPRPAARARGGARSSCERSQCCIGSSAGCQHGSFKVERSLEILWECWDSKGIPSSRVEVL
ncbi:hypothetical protein C8J57DRAFT_1254885 [Mycena rebaudengoi]|nr:hypothetical protein C8J57DRAFT_1254885 [Mycena rebaudengoi]